MNLQRSGLIRARRCAAGGAGLAILAACSAPHARSASTADRYTTKAFLMPFSITVDSALEPEPAVDNPNLLFWNGKNLDSKVRFLVPREVYRPHSTVPESPPKDYLNFIRGLAADGVKFSNVVTLTVDGHPATVMTTTTTVGLAGSIGCPTKGQQQAEECFGFSPDHMARLAVIDVDGKPLLAWAFATAAAPDAPPLAGFETMLRTIKFRS